MDQLLKGVAAVPRSLPSRRYGPMLAFHYASKGQGSWKYRLQLYRFLVYIEKTSPKDFLWKKTQEGAQVILTDLYPNVPTGFLGPSAYRQMAPHHELLWILLTLDRDLCCFFLIWNLTVWIRAKHFSLREIERFYFTSKENKTWTVGMLWFLNWQEVWQKWIVSQILTDSTAVTMA